MVTRAQRGSLLVTEFLLATRAWHCQAAIRAGDKNGLNHAPARLPRVASLGAAVRRLARQRELVLLGAVVLLSRGATVNFGDLSTQAIALVVLALLFVGLALRASDWAPAPAPAWAVAVAACGATALVIGSALGSVTESLIALALAASTAALVLGPPRRVVPVLVLAAAGSAVALMAVPWHGGYSPLDVSQSVQRAATAILHGQNPYLTTFSSPDAVAPGTFVMKTIHFQYLPGVALLAAAGQLMGDVRIMGALAMVAIVIAVVWLAREAGQGDDTGRRATHSVRVLALCLAMPMTAVMVLLGWVDVYSVAGFAGWMALRRSHPRWAIACLALSLTIKPTILIALVPALFWSRLARREAAVAALAAALIALPFVLATGPAAFYQDVLGVQVQFGFRSDALTLSALSFALFGQQLPFWLALALGAVCCWFALQQRPRTLADVLIAGAFLSIGAFLLSKWAFLNYYFIPVWLLLMAVGARGLAFEAERDIAVPAPLTAAWRWCTEAARRARGGRAPQPT